MPTHTLGTQPWLNPSRSDGRALRGHGNDSGPHWARSSLIGGAVRERSVRIKGRMTTHPGHSVGEEPKRATTELSKKGTVPRTGRERTGIPGCLTFLTSTPTVTCWRSWPGGIRASTLMFSSGEMLERLALRARILAVHVATHSRSRTPISWSYVHVLTADYHSPFLWLSHSTHSWWSFVVTSVTSVSLLFTTVFPL